MYSADIVKVNDTISLWSNEVVYTANLERGSEALGESTA